MQVYKYRREFTVRRIWSVYQSIDIFQSLQEFSRKLSLLCKIGMFFNPEKCLHREKPQGGANSIQTQLESPKLHVRFLHPRMYCLPWAFHLLAEGIFYFINYPYSSIHNLYFRSSEGQFPECCGF